MARKAKTYKHESALFNSQVPSGSNLTQSKGSLATRKANATVEKLHQSSSQGMLKPKAKGNPHQSEFVQRKQLIEKNFYSQSQVANYNTSGPLSLPIIHKSYINNIGCSNRQEAQRQLPGLAKEPLGRKASQ